MKTEWLQYIPIGFFFGTGMWASTVVVSWLSAAIKRK